MRSRGAALLGLVMVVVPALLLSGGITKAVGPAQAEVVRLGGFSASVDGHRGWFGSYDMAGIGTAWCVDHGIAAPDADYRYLPTELAEASPSTRTAMAWALGRYGHAPDRVTSAALTLVLHDLVGAPYPSGPLAVGRLAPGQLSGFEGKEQEVLARARAIKADAGAHAHLRGPLSLSVTADTGDTGGGNAVRPGGAGLLIARLTDSAGAGVPGVHLGATATGATLTPKGAAPTDARGEQRFPFVAGAGENRFHVTGMVADLKLQSFAPSTRRAQRVARPGRVAVSAGFRLVAQTRRLSIRKTGDASAYLPLAGARFQVRPMSGASPETDPAGELVTGGDGTSSALELGPGVYRVTEVAAPPGYATAGPWTADLTATDVVLDVANAAVPGRAKVTKVDAGTGRALAGATLSLLHDADRDGAYETPLGQWVSGGEPAARDLRPGDYEVREVIAPDGYRLGDQPVRFSVRPAGVSEVMVANARLAVAPPAVSSLSRWTRGLQPRGRLPDTGQPLSLLALAGAALVAGGLFLEAVGSRPALRARRRGRRLASPLPHARARQ